MAGQSKKISIIGGGPGGLFLAILLRQHRPDWEIQVWERNAPHATFGFGVVFSDRTVELLDKADPVSLERIRAEFQSWTDIEVGTWHGVRRTSGHGFSAIARHRLLAILQQRARELDIPVSYEHEALDFDKIYEESDLLVGADGINSLVREHWAEEFQPDIRMGRARFIWFATPRRYDALTFHFVETPYGPFSTHAYPFSEELSTFIVEVDVDTWRRAGLDPADRPALGIGEDDEVTKAFCEEIFKESLQGQHLVGNASQWRQFPTVRNKSWRAADKVVILGDAAHTAHFSVGSGTKMAMEDAAGLAEVLLEHDSPAQALIEYERVRKPSVTKIQQLAEPSRGWWENFQDWVDRDVDAVSVNFLTRTGRETVEHLAKRDPDFAAQTLSMSALDASVSLPGGLLVSNRRGIRLPEDRLERQKLLSITAGQSAAPGIVVLNDSSASEIDDIRAMLGDTGALLVGDYSDGLPADMPNGIDLAVVRPGAAAPAMPFAVLLSTPASIDDEQGWARLLADAQDAEAAGASAVCIEAMPSDYDRRSLLVHAGVVVRPHLRIPIIVWDCSSDQEALTHVNADRADLAVGVPSAGFFPGIYERLGLESLVAPESVVVVGASQSPAKAGNALMNNLSDFSGEVYGLGRSDGEVNGRRIVSDMSEIDGHIDLAVLAVPSQAVPAALETLGKHDVRAAIVCSGGFAETASDEGVALQKEVDKVRRRHGMRILGPNTSGMSIPGMKLHASFVPAVTRVAAGDVAVLAQSGGVAHATALALNAAGVGIGTMIGTGNASDVDLPELITLMADREEHSCIAVHLEGTADGLSLAQAIAGATPSVPVVVLKSGVSDVDRLASSHTGALTGDWAVAQAMLTEAGAVVVSTLGDLVDAVTALSLARLSPSSATPAAGVVTGQAGPGILLTDRLQTLGIEVPPLGEDSVQKIQQLLPALTHRQNPVDTGRPGENFSEVITTVGEDPGVDAVAVYVLLEPGAVDLEASLSQAAKKMTVPIIASTNGLVDEVCESQEQLREMGIPLFENPERAARGTWALFEDRRAAHLRSLRSEGTVDVLPHTLTETPRTESSAKAFLADSGVPSPRARVCVDRGEAIAAFADVMSDVDEVVVKVHSEHIGHKAAAGGVHLGIRTKEQFDAALDAIDLIDRADAGYLIEQQVPSGEDLFIAVRRDPSWGMIGLLGVGGGDVETAGSVDLFPLPTSVDSLSEKLAGISPELTSVTEQVLRIYGVLASGVSSWPDANSFEVNPLRVTPDGLFVLDALVDRQDM